MRALLAVCGEDASPNSSDGGRAAATSGAVPEREGPHPPGAGDWIACARTATGDESCGPRPEARGPRPLDRTALQLAAPGRRAADVPLAGVGQHGDHCF